MEDLRGRTFLRKKLKAYFICYGGSSILFLAALSGSLLFRGYRSSLDAEVKSLSDLNASFSKEQTTLKDLNSRLREITSVLPSAISDESSSKYLCAGLDTIKSTLPKAQLSIGNLESRGDEVVMPVTISGPLNDYTAFVQAISHLQDMRFPFFTVSALNMKAGQQEKGRGPVSYELRGIVRTPQVGGTGDGEHRCEEGT